MAADKPARETRGYAQTDVDDDQLGSLEPWEALVVDAVGNVIDFWKFKRNHGRIWALLYLRGVRMSVPELQTALGLSKGAGSMLTRELEHWGVIHRVRSPADTSWNYVAETHLMTMVMRVVEERERALVLRVATDLAAAIKLAQRAKVDPAVIERIERMSKLATVVEKSIDIFLRTARFDLSEAGAVLSMIRGGIANRAKSALRAKGER